MCFVWISEQTAIISLYSIIWLVFIPEMECVYCAVWTGSSKQFRLMAAFKWKRINCLYNRISAICFLFYIFLLNEYNWSTNTSQPNKSKPRPFIILLKEPVLTLSSHLRLDLSKDFFNPRFRPTIVVHIYYYSYAYYMPRHIVQSPILSSWHAEVYDQFVLHHSLSAR